jgi:subtilase family serine protease
MTSLSLSRPALVAAAAVFMSACQGPANSMLSTAPSPFAVQRAAGRGCAAADAVRCLVSGVKLAMGPADSGWAPADLQARYKLPSSTKGSGKIVAIVDAYDNPNVASDLATYRSYYGLGTASFTKYNQQGKTGNYPQGSTGWGVQIDLDVEMVSASCPLCTIYLIEGNSADGSDLGASVREAVKLGAHIVNTSWVCAGSDTCVSKKAFDANGVVYLAAAGSGGGVTAPSAFDTVVAVGGTILSKNGSQYSESIWSPPGGCAIGIKKPKWQHDSYCKYRLTNDVAAVANDVAAYDSYGYNGWAKISGTGVASPLLAGLFGLAGNASKQKGGRTFWMARHHQDLYTLSGSCGGYGYGQYTTCTGWGSPNGIGAF